MAGEINQWKLALRESFGVRDWVDDATVEKAIHDYVATSLRVIAAGAFELTDELIEAVAEAGSAGNLDPDMLPHILRVAYDHPGPDKQSPAGRIAHDLNVRHKEALAGDELEKLEAVIQDLIDRLRSRLIWSRLPEVP